MAKSSVSSNIFQDLMEKREKSKTAEPVKETEKKIEEKKAEETKKKRSTEKTKKEKTVSAEEPSVSAVRAEKKSTSGKTGPVKGSSAGNGSSAKKGGGAQKVVDSYSDAELRNLIESYGAKEYYDHRITGWLTENQYMLFADKCEKLGVKQSRVLRFLVQEFLER